MPQTLQVVRSGSKRPNVGMDASSSHKSKTNTGIINPMASCAVIGSSAPTREQQGSWEDLVARGDGSSSDAHLAPYPSKKGTGIVRTVGTMVVVGAVDACDEKRKTGYVDL